MSNLKRYIYGAVGGGALVLFVLFSFDVAELSSGANDRLNAMYNRAVVDNLTPICVAQFREDGNGATEQSALRGLGDGAQIDYVKEKGWATMPGRDAPDERIADDCARRILRLDL